MGSIGHLLTRRGIQLETPVRPVAGAATRAPLTKYLWRAYPRLHAFKKALANAAGGKTFRYPAPDPADRELLGQLARAEAIQWDRARNLVSCPQPWARAYLTGAWLEEFAALAARAGGADEVFFSQRVAWWASSRPADGGPRKRINEIDVIARRGGVLSFTSCKALTPIYDGADRQHIRDSMLEADYWRSHFLGGDGRAVLLVATDLIDEVRQNRPRCPGLFDVARVVEVDFLGSDLPGFEAVAEAYRRHW
ncbi:hypothetical protein SAMN05421742_11333 [Roseospirillum parvum]|uniref:Uncharacterized protein n=2 Tax=Roseospirillum parvum TaxID=83401 RepID=A0A1G8FCS2_9PROT|nr:hypothetical protein SAMN05421742_11333 [Roseospirillum parvum]